MRFIKKCRLIFIFSFLILFITNTYEPKSLNKSVQKIILIDPGHGGIDGGAVSNNTVEKDLNLDISLKLRDVLSKNGYKVYMTRETDICLSNGNSVKEIKREDLNKRCLMKKEKSCDVFISIHMNKFSDKKASGSQVWYPIYSDKSKRLAEQLHIQFKQTLNQNNNRQAKGVKNDYVILRDGYEGASVILECGFISNEEEEMKLKSLDYQQELCNAIELAIKNYFNGGI